MHSTVTGNKRQPTKRDDARDTEDNKMNAKEKLAKVTPQRKSKGTPQETKRDTTKNTKNTTKEKKQHRKR